MKILVGVAVALVVIVIIATLMKSGKQKKELAQALRKMQALGEAFKGYVADSNGLLPYEDAPGKDDWLTAAKPEAAEVWYNVLPKRLGAPSVGELGKDDRPSEFYQPNYPLFIEGAPYPKSNKKLAQPYFAIAMNSRLQRKNEDGTKARGTMASIEKPGNTVVLLERGMPGDEEPKIMGRYDATAKAGADEFVGRHNQKGILLFVDGHTEVHPISNVVDKSGRAITPQETIVWTPDPEEAPY